MEISLKDAENCKKELEATLNYDELQPHFEKALHKYKQKISIPGFRKGKAPISIIKKMYGDSIEYSALEDIASEVFAGYVDENEIDMVGKGSIVDINYDPGKTFSFKVAFEVKPDVDAQNYKGIELTRRVNKIDDSLVDEEVKYHLFRRASLELDGEALDDDYVVTLDVQNLDDAGNVLIGQSEKDVRVYLNNKDIYPELKNGLKGIKENEERNISLKDKDGKIVKAKVTAKKVEKVVLPELNEELFKSITGKDDIKDEGEFKNVIKDELQKIYDDISERSLKNEAVNEVIKLNDITVPDTFINVILDSYVEDYKKQMPKNHKITDDELNEFRETKRIDAILQSKWFLLRESIAKKENIAVVDEDYLKEAEENSKRFNIPADKLKEIYKNNPDLTAKLLNDKIINYLIENAVITEKEESKDINNQ